MVQGSEILANLATGSRAAGNGAMNSRHNIFIDINKGHPSESTTKSTDGMKICQYLALKILSWLGRARVQLPRDYRSGDALHRFGDLHCVIRRFIVVQHKFPNAGERVKRKPITYVWCLVLGDNHNGQTMAFRRRLWWFNVDPRADYHFLFLTERPDHRSCLPFLESEEFLMRESYRPISGNDSVAYETDQKYCQLKLFSSRFHSPAIERMHGVARDWDTTLLFSVRNKTRIRSHRGLEVVLQSCQKHSAMKMFLESMDSISG